MKPGKSFMRRLFALVNAVSQPHHYVKLGSEARADLACAYGDLERAVNGDKVSVCDCDIRCLWVMGLRRLPRLGRGVVSVGVVTSGRPETDCGEGAVPRPHSSSLLGEPGAWEDGTVQVRQPCGCACLAGLRHLQQIRIPAVA